MRLGSELSDSGQGFDRDSGRGMHACVERYQPRRSQDLGLELLERKVDAAYREAVAPQPSRGLGQGERLPPQFVRVDQDDLEGGRYLDFGRCAKGAGPGSRLAPASFRRARYCCHISSWRRPYSYSRSHE